MNLRPYLDFTTSLAYRAGRITLGYYNTGIRPDFKADDTPVTAADRAAERAISRLISKRFPDHGVVGEEDGSLRAEAQWRWIIDPIDGTRSFITGTPMWGTLIGLLDAGRPAFGIMNQPFTRERFWSGEDGAFMRVGDAAPTPIRTRACPNLSDAILSTTHPELFAAGIEADGFARLKNRVRMARYGGDCYGYCLLAAGFVDVIVEAGLKSYDIVALIPIIEKAGGRVTTWDGKPATEGGRIVATGDARLHEQVLAVLAG